MKNKVLRIGIILFFPLFLKGQFSDSIPSILHEVSIESNYNPALRIMKQAIHNKSLNSPYNNPFFSCHIYHKLLFTTDLMEDSIFLNKIDSLQYRQQNFGEVFSRQDSQYLNIYDFVSRHHLFLMETVSQKLYKKPQKEYEKLLAQRTSGIKDPFLALYATQIQSFSFYKEDVIILFDTKYVSPISQSALNKYQYRLLKTIINQGDTLFEISFQPKKHAHFMSLAGKLLITSNHYAIQEIVITPYDKKLNMPFCITHRYKEEKNGTWFPEKITYEIQISGLGLVENNVNLKVISSQHISEIDIQNELKNKDFGFSEIEVEEHTMQKEKEILRTHRCNPLDSLEMGTYSIWDSIGKKTKLDRWMFFTKTLANGYLPLGVIDIDLDKTIKFNTYEKVRIGIGVYSNRRMCQWAGLGGYFAYGFGDHSWKWGGSIYFTFIRARDFGLRFDYSSDIHESAGSDFFDRSYTIFSGEFYRSWLIGKFDHRNRIQAQLQGKISRSLTGYITNTYTQFTPRYTYNYQSAILTNNHPFIFQDFSLRMGVRIGIKESTINNGDFNFYKVSPYPIIMLQYTHGFPNVIKSGYSYNRLDLKITHRQEYRILGYSDFALYGGIVDRDLPYPLLYTPHAGYAVLGFDGKEQFSVMRPHEFISDRYISFFFRHNFGRMTQNKTFSPRICIAQNICFGSMIHPEHHYGVQFKTLEKGYFESGIIVEDLLVIYKVLSFGVGVFYRYGAYTLPKEIDNFAFKIRFRVSMTR